MTLRRARPARGRGGTRRGRRSRSRPTGWSTPPGCTPVRWRVASTGLDAAPRAAGALRQGQLFHARRAGRRSRAWSIRRRWTPGWACTSRSTSAGQVRFGPDLEWLDVDAPEAIDYAVDPRARRVPSRHAIRRYWPGLPAGALRPDYSGVRPTHPRPRRGGAGLPHRRPGAPWRGRAGQPVRHRVARADLGAGHRRARGRAAGADALNGRGARRPKKRGPAGPLSSARRRQGRAAAVLRPSWPRRCTSRRWRPA